MKIRPAKCESGFALRATRSQFQPTYDECDLRHGAACHPSQFPVGAAGENNRNLGSHHDSRCERPGQVLKLLKEDIAGFQLGDQKNDLIFLIRAASLEMALSNASGPSTSSRDLSAIHHLAKGGGIERRRDGGVH